MKSFTFHLTLSFLFVMSIAGCAAAKLPATPAPPSGTVLFQDTFDSPNTGWERFVNDGGTMDYFGGGFRILVQKPGLNYWSTPQKNYGDVRVEADVLRLGGPEENRMGVMCRYERGDYYFFIISDDGYYAIGKFIGGTTLLLGNPEMQPSDLIQKDAVNHLRADCVGSNLTFYINFNQVAAVQDGDLPTGDVGLLAGSFNEPGVDVSFDNFVVMQP